jgi:diaminopimelate epimerase
VSPKQIRLRVHERGTGETLACGTGACGAVAVGRRHGLLGEEVEVDVRGGQLIVSWAGDGQHIWLTGPTETAYEGRVEV